MSKGDGIAAVKAKMAAEFAKARGETLVVNERYSMEFGDLETVDVDYTPVVFNQKTKNLVNKAVAYYREGGTVKFNEPITVVPPSQSFRAIIQMCLRAERHKFAKKAVRHDAS